MFEDNSYEPIAEIYITLTDQPSYDDIYCLCSRVFVDGEISIAEEESNNLVEEEEPAEETIKSGCSGESTVRFCNSSTESQPALTPKKSHDEAVSCYCSASHYSTDEHDSLRDISTLHHSDSGADLSESSRDVDWEKYWTLHGERLIWESWISKYGSYIDPNYLYNGNSGNQRPADGDEASFCIQAEKVPDPNQKTSFTGLLGRVRTTSEKTDNLGYQESVVKEEKVGECLSAPKILVESVLADDFLNRRLSDISDTGKSLSGRSDNSSNFDDQDKLRLGVYSRCSGSSAPLSATTDSMTNVTRITLSSSDSSYGVDDSSAKSSSILSSSDSGSSVDQQWQHLWTDHFNEQYYYHYSKFTERLKKRNGGEDVKSDSGFIVDDCNRQSEPQHQESIDDVGSIETQDSVSEGDQSKPPSVEGSTQSSTKSDKSKKCIQSQRLLSVGYLLQQLNAMSVEPSEGIKEEDESINTSSRPSIMESVQNCSQKRTSVVKEACEVVKDESGGSEETGTVEDCDTKVVSKDCNDPDFDKKDSRVGDKAKSSDEADMVANCIEDSTNARHGVKRSHADENDEVSVDKVKSAYQLMGLMYDLGDTKKIRKASVWYKKRFSQIRFQNRILRLPKNPNKHIYFDDDEQNCDATTTQVKSSDDKNDQDINDSGELYKDAAETSLVSLQYESIAQRKLDMEDFSEKDDSTDDEEIYFSAEEDNLVDSNSEKWGNKLKALPKRRKKRQLKKKSVVSYPEEMVANPKIKKFWRRRYSLFSKFDEGIKMDAESWYSVTPEKIAVNIAERCQCDLVVDAFCGAGGNAIQLAFTCERVIAIDIDPLKIELARSNARVYGVEDRIDFILGDYLQVAPSLSADVVFLSPPWGGPSYKKQGVFPLSALLPVSGQQLFQVTSAITDNIAFYLPKNINTHELVESAGPGGCVEVVQNFLDRELVAVTAYFGELVNSVE